MSLLKNVIISVLGAKMARGRSPIVAALIALLVSRAMSGRAEEGKPAADGLSLRLLAMRAALAA